MNEQVEIAKEFKKKDSIKFISVWLLGIILVFITACAWFFHSWAWALFPVGILGGLIIYLVKNWYMTTEEDRYRKYIEKEEEFRKRLEDKYQEMMLDEFIQGGISSQQSQDAPEENIIPLINKGINSDLSVIPETDVPESDLDLTTSGLDETTSPINDKPKSKKETMRNSQKEEQQENDASNSKASNKEKQRIQNETINRQLARPNKTEKTSNRKERVGQMYFRQELLRRFDNKCAVTGCRITEILKASHIVPWSDSTEGEKLDPDNGILLNPVYDALFDKHLISFEKNGDIIISKRLTDNTIKQLEIDKSAKINIYGRMEEYLSRHRQILSSLDANKTNQN